MPPPRLRKPHANPRALLAGRYDLRQFGRSPGFAVTAVLTLAVGIGANLAIFGLTTGFFCARLPIPSRIALFHSKKSHRWPPAIVGRP